jgi:NitT/TauT family transport system substrate-binding protein
MFMTGVERLALKRPSRFGLVVAAAVLIACGGTSNQPAPGGSVAPADINIGVGVVDPGFAQLWTAQLRGYFKPEALNVHISVVGANIIASLVGGQIDLGIQGSSAAMTPVKDGAETSIIYATSAKGDAAYGFAQQSQITALTQCKRVGTSQVGTASYAWSVIEKQLFNGKFDIVPASTPTTVASLASGNVDCAVGALSTFTNLVTNGKIHTIVDPLNPSSLPQTFVKFIQNDNEASMFGMKANLSSKKPAIVRFLRAYHKALKEVNTGSPTDLASYLKSNSPDWAPFETNALAAALENQQHFNAPGNGYLPEAAWANSLQFFMQGGATYIDVNDKKWSYQQRVDMSYYDQAIGKPKS